MSYLLEVLGRGLLANLMGAFANHLSDHPDDTTEDLERIVEDNPEDMEAHLRLGSRYLQRSDPVAARQIFLHILSQDGSAIGARLGLACVFDELDQLDVAIEQLRIAQKAEPANPAILFCLGYCHERCGDVNEGISYYSDSISLCPTLRNAHERLAAIYLTQDNLDLAIHHYSALCELDPQQIDLHLTLANLLLRSGDHKEAIERYEHALILEPDNWAAHNDAVSAYEEAGLIREAIEHLHKMIENEGDFPDTRLRLGDLYSRIHDDVSALAHYEKAIEECPEYLEANVKIGTLHLRAGNYKESARWFSFALEINDRLLNAYIGIGVAQHADGRANEALASFDMARNIEPNSTLLFTEVARMHLKAAASQQADKYFSSPGADNDILQNADLPAEIPLSKLDPDESEASTDPISAQIQRLRDAIEQQPNHADLYYRLGLLLRNRGQVEDAIAAFQEAVVINPSYMKALIKLGLSLNEMNRTDEAIQIFKQAVEVQPDYMDLHYRLGLMFAQQHQFEMAVEHYEYAVGGNPQNVSFQANLALALQSMGLIDRAKATWQIVNELEHHSAAAKEQSRHGKRVRHHEPPE